MLVVDKGEASDGVAFILRAAAMEARTIDVSIVKLDMSNTLPKGFHQRKPRLENREFEPPDLRHKHPGSIVPGILRHRRTAANETTLKGQNGLIFV